MFSVSFGYTTVFSIGVLLAQLAAGQSAAGTVAVLDSREF
jgi:hypothetical protein